jgi:type IV pilus assembly protein PilC
MKTFWWIILLVVGILVTAYKLYYRTVSGQYNLDSAKLKIPLIGDLLRKIALSRFTHTFSLSFKSGINLLTCLDIARETTANARLELAIKKARDSVNVGEKLATALEVSHEFPSMVVRMIAVGEQSGALTNILTKVSEFYDKDVASTIKKMFTAFEPIMIVIMGVVVGGIAMSVFLPLFTMIRTVGGD